MLYDLQLGLPSHRGMSRLSQRIHLGKPRQDQRGVPSRTGSDTGPTSFRPPVCVGCPTRRNDAVIYGIAREFGKLQHGIVSIRLRIRFTVRCAIVAWRCMSDENRV
jgi:hypothetical protein